jgi:hypothetical protein
MLKEKLEVVVTEAYQMNLLHSQIVGAQVEAKTKAAELGQMLIDKKEELKHGEFIPWVETNCDFSDRSAQDYMKIAKSKAQRAADFNACTSIREVLELGKPKQGPKASGTTVERKPKLDKDDRRKIDKLRKVAEDPATPEPMRESVEAKLKGYEEAHGKNFDDYINTVIEDEENENRPYIDTEYVAQEMAKVVLDGQYDYEWRLAQIQDWLEQAFDDDDKLMREFNWIMENKDKSHD